MPTICHYFFSGTTVRGAGCQDRRDPEILSPPRRDQKIPDWEAKVLGPQHPRGQDRLYADSHPPLL